MSELKPCPFCGWEFAEHAWNEFGEEYRVCDQCGASSGTVDSKWDWQSRPIEDELRKRIAELESQLEEHEVMKNRVAELKAERKEFCPNCEAETPCTHEAELFVCDICGEDFAKYIVLRNCTLPDVSTTQDVTTPEPPEGA